MQDAVAQGLAPLRVYDKAIGVLSEPTEVLLLRVLELADRRLGVPGGRAKAYWACDRLCSGSARFY